MELSFREGGGKQTDRQTVRQAGRQADGVVGAEREMVWGVRQIGERDRKTEGAVDTKKGHRQADRQTGKRSKSRDGERERYTERVRARDRQTEK